jgi:hypothetical protein
MLRFPKPFCSLFDVISEQEDMMSVNEIQRGPIKRDWTAPTMRRLEAGGAESQRGAFPDGGGGNQGS